uniref:Uncharacterized protein TCIL3000_11_7810 n=1 Tax=Trypanosoma congolense (strain IL3000) TaxID=1068625 RepID=G0V121_TRYCI|nr:unnamed protein product [Trypanosoma congolense IL3000]
MVTHRTCPFNVFSYYGTRFFFILMLNWFITFFHFSQPLNFRNMDVVEKFLSLRREGRGEEAYRMLAPGAAMGCPWGGMHYGENVRNFLKDEARFTRKGYLDPVSIEKIDENTFQRKFRWDRGMYEYGNSGFKGLGILPMWREIYFVDEKGIRLVTANKQLKNRSLLSFFGL